MRTVSEGIRRTHEAAQRYTVPLTGGAIRAIVAARPPKTLKAVRARALLLPGFGGRSVGPNSSLLTRRGPDPRPLAGRRRSAVEVVARAGLAPALVSGYPLRAGLATSAALTGRSDRAVTAQGRWKSRMMVDRYVRSAEAWQDNAAAGLQ